MRTEDELRRIADKASEMLSRGQIDHMDKTTLLVDGYSYEVERIRGIRDALDWAVGDDDEEPI